MKARKTYLRLALIAVWFGPSIGGTQAPSGSNAAPDLGAQIATAGTSNGVAACASCHGGKGEGNAASGFPRIAGQPSAYLERQLSSYANGTRSNPIMQPIAKALSPPQIVAVSRYYAGLDALAAKPVSSPAAQVPQRGRILAELGDEKIGVQSCANCHGPGGAGTGTPYPYLAGQHASYLQAALSEWKSGARSTDSSGQMPTIAKRLTETDITALVAYYAAQPAPLPDARRANLPSGSAAKPVTIPMPARSDTTPTKGVGIEQGEPTSGGAQGPGGGGGASGSGSSGGK